MKQIAKMDNSKLDMTDFDFAELRNDRDFITKSTNLADVSVAKCCASELVVRGIVEKHTTFDSSENRHCKKSTTKYRKPAISRITRV